MAVIATVSKACPSGLVYLVPGRLYINKNGPYYTPPTEEICIDIMPTGAEFVLFRKPTVRLKLLAPTGCVFEVPNSQIPNWHHYSQPIDPTTQVKDKTQIRDEFWNPNEPQGAHLINRNNSLSYRLPITGRADRDVKIEIVVTGEPVQVVADSCKWTVDGLALDTTNTRGQPLDAI